MSDPSKSLPRRPLAAASTVQATTGTTARDSVSSEAPEGRGPALTVQAANNARAAARIAKKAIAGPTPSPRPAGRRVARLRVTHVDPLSVMKTAFLLSVAIGVVIVVAVGVVWSVLSVTGVWDSINKSVADVVGGNSSSTFDIRNYLGTGRVMGFTLLVAVVDVVLLTAIATLGAFLYNLSAVLLGGVEVSFTEEG